MLAKHDRANIGETQFNGLIGNISKLPTKVNLDAIECQTLKSFLVLIDNLPQRGKKQCSTAGDIVAVLADPLVKFVLVSGDNIRKNI
jgi:hypothetical protein